MTSLISLMLCAAEPSLEAALQQAVTREAAKVELIAWDPPRCQGLHAPAPFARSGRVAVRVRGPRCEGWGWAQVRVTTQAATLIRDVQANAGLDGAWILSEAEPRGEALTRIPLGATATRSLRKGMEISAADVRFGPSPGTAVTVRLVAGALSLEQRGTISPCSGAQTCATLPNGKKVSGEWIDGTLVIGDGS